MATTNHLSLTFVEQSQSQKEVTVNKALSLLDAVLNTGAIDRGINTPPGSPAEGDVYIVGSSPTGAWSGKAAQVAYYDQVWRFIAPNEGMTLWVNDEDALYSYDGSGWVSSGGGGGGASVLDDLTDVTITSAADNHFLVHDGADWVNESASTARTSMGLGSLATKSTADLSTSDASGTLAAARFPALSGDVTTSSGSLSTSIANSAVTYAKIQNVSATNRVLGRSTAGAGVVEEITCTSFGRSLIDDADAAAGRTTLGVVIGTDVQAYDGTLAALAGVTTSSDKLIYATGSDTFATTDISSTARNLIGDTSTSAMRTTLGLAIGTDVQAYDADLTAVAGLSANGMVARTGSGTASVRTITGISGEITVTNGDGVSGSPTLAAGSDMVKKNVVNAFTKQQYFSTGSLSDGTNIAWNLDDNQVATVTLGGNRTLSNPSNLKNGGSYILIVKQDGTGSRTLAYGSNYKWPSGTAPTLSTGANDVDIITFVSDGTNMYGVAQKDFS